MPSTMLKGKEEERDHLPLKHLTCVLFPSPSSPWLPPSLALPGRLLAIKFSNHEMKGVFLIKKRSSGYNRADIYWTLTLPGTVFMHTLIAFLQQSSIGTPIIISILQRRMLRSRKNKKTCLKPCHWERVELEFKPRPRYCGIHCSSKCGLESGASPCLLTVVWWGK